MVDPKREIGLKEISGKPEDPGKSPKVKFEVFGEEMIEKEVKWSGNTGRVYLPPDWVGKYVKIIRID
jgi:putative transposon-encoded protein